MEKNKAVKKITGVEVTKCTRKPTGANRVLLSGGWLRIGRAPVPALPLTCCGLVPKILPN